MVWSVRDLIQLKTKGFLFWFFLYCCFSFLPDWVLNLAVCKSADAGVKKTSGEKGKSWMIFLLGAATLVSLKSGWDFSVCMVAGELKLNEIGPATFLPALALLDDSSLLLLLGTGTKPVQEATLAKTTTFFFSGLTFLPGLFLSRVRWVPVLTQERGWVWRMLT